MRRVVYSLAAVALWVHGAVFVLVAGSSGALWAQSEQLDLLTDDPGVARSLNSLAATLVGEGRSIEAERLYRRALAIREKTLGPDHPDTAATLQGLADAL